MYCIYITRDWIFSLLSVSVTFIQHYLNVSKLKSEKKEEKEKTTTKANVLKKGHYVILTLSLLEQKVIIAFATSLELGQPAHSV